MLMLGFLALASHFARGFGNSIACLSNKRKDPAQGNAPGLPMG
jgi:hypothetical protein